MKRNIKNLDAIIDSTAGRIREDEPDRTLIEDAANRVWSRLTENGSMYAADLPHAVAHGGEASRIEGCADYQTLIPAYLRGELSTARKLLLEDHAGECVPCRRALKQMRTHTVAAPARETHSAAQKMRGTNLREAVFGRDFAGTTAMASVTKWRIAAALAASFALVSFLVLNPFGGRNFGGVVQAADGAVYRVADEESRVLASGEAVTTDEPIRTARDAHAVVRLNDGSVVEMRERSQFSLAEHRRGATLNVERGDFIVQMPDGNVQSLYVATGDGLISATGATFAVASGTKGTRVSVIRGAATIDANGTSKELKAGEQFTTQTNLEARPLVENVKWSRDAARYNDLIAQLQATGADINARAARPGVRYSTRLLDLAPADTVFYVALPNWSRTLADARAILQERMSGNAALREWWQARGAAGQGRAGEFDSMLERVRAWGDELKDEIVIAAGRDATGAQGAHGRVLLLSEVKDPARFRQFVSEQIAALGSDAASQSSQPRVRFVDDPLATEANDGEANGATADAPEVFIWQHEDLVAVSPQLAVLRELSRRINANNSQPGFTATSLHNRLAALYREGTSLIIAADLERVLASELNREDKQADEKNIEQDARERAAFQQTGLTDVRHFIIESKDATDRTMNRAVLSFNSERRGVAAWLAAPAPMGSLNYISPEASMAAAFVVKKPEAAVGDFFDFLKTADPALWQTLADAQATNNIDVARDLAAPLGGEVAFAIDGPVLPVPSWKVIFEVYDPARLNATFERLVARLNEVAQREGKRGFVSEQTEAGGKTFYAIKSLDIGLSLNYTYADNYLILTPSRALLDRTLRFRDAGMTLARAPRFTAALPTDANANFSAIFYQNLGSVLDPLTRTMRGFGGDDGAAQNSEAQQALNALNTFAPPALAYVRADADTITVAAPTKGGPFGITPGTLLGIPSGGFSLQEIIEQGTGAQ